MAIYESIRRRLERQEDLLHEPEQLSPAQRNRRLAQLQGRMTDAEQDEDDLDDADRERLTDQFTAAVELDQLKPEIAALQELLAHPHVLVWRFGRRDGARGEMMHPGVTEAESSRCALAPTWTAPRPWRA